MQELPSHADAASALLRASGLAGALFGGAEAAREVVGGGLLLSDGAVLALLAVGTAAGCVLSVLATLPLALFTRRPLGRTRWMGFLWGLYTPVFLSCAVGWFTDPPPFVEPWPYQGNVPAFLGLTIVSLGIVLAFYQGARGVQSVVGCALVLAASLGAWTYTGAVGTPPATQALPAGAPNVLLVTLDTTRADRFGAYGNEHVDTRIFDGLAGEGALFLDAVAASPVTGPSHATLLSGVGPWSHGMLLNGMPLPAERPLLAEVLHDHGWRTGAFVSAFVLDGGLGFRRGFEVYDDDFGWLRGGSALLPMRLWAMADRRVDPDAVLDRRGADTVDLALRWIEGQAGAWFLWVHLFDAHGPYAPPPPWDTRYYSGDREDPANTSMLRVQNVAPYLARSLEGVTDLDWVLAQYDGEVSYADSQLGRLLARVDRANTLVAVIADHGESLGEHGVWFNHGDDVYETSVHVPFALAWPGRVAAGLRVASPFEGGDLAPTLLELVGLTPPESMEGRSAAADLSAGAGRAVARSLCFDRVANKAARERGEIEAPKWRMAGLRGPTSRYTLREQGGEDAYFDLGADPRGVTDVRASTASSPEGAELLGILRSQAEDLFAGGLRDDARSDAEVERLKLLGYTDP